MLHQDSASVVIPVAWIGFVGLDLILKAHLLDSLGYELDIRIADRQVLADLPTSVPGPTDVKIFGPEDPCLFLVKGHGLSDKGVWSLLDQYRVDRPVLSRPRCDLGQSQFGLDHGALVDYVPLNIVGVGRVLLYRDDLGLLGLLGRRVDDVSE